MKEIEKLKKTRKRLTQKEKEEELMKKLYEEIDPYEMIEIDPYEYPTMIDDLHGDPITNKGRKKR